MKNLQEAIFKTQLTYVPMFLKSIKLVIMPSLVQQFLIQEKSAPLSRTQATQGTVIQSIIEDVLWKTLTMPMILKGKPSIFMKVTGHGLVLQDIMGRKHQLNME